MYKIHTSKWNAGTLERWNAGTLERWNAGTRAQWNAEALALLERGVFKETQGGDFQDQQDDYDIGSS
ncbi:hypothetical protein EB118_08965 [bacterium]|nr:hypothetical protein [bacterium]NDD84439.1 hypothetical protein [bacterium]NDG30191.1 hypothetical protein [bacterium]